MKVLNLVVLLFISSFLTAQIQTYFVAPATTDSNYGINQGDHAITINTNLSINKLFLFLGGTNTSSNSNYYSTLRDFAANLGYDVIKLSYVDSVAAATLTNSNDSLVFNKYREEINFGTPVSSDVTVDTLNSNYIRFLKLLQYLDVNYPSQNWGQYLLSPTSIDWSKIAIGGHSQGAGHASYLAKHFSMERVLMFSGPNDYSTTFSNSANWLRQSGVTPTNNHFVYLSLNDEIVDFSKQFVNISGLGMLMNDDTTLVDNIAPPYGFSQALYTVQPPQLIILNHNVPPIKNTSINHNAWTYMLTTPIITGIKNTTITADSYLYPNPSNNLIVVSNKKALSTNLFKIVNINGQTVLSGYLPLTEINSKNSIDVSFLSEGFYFLIIDNQAIKFVKK